MKSLEAPLPLAQLVEVKNKTLAKSLKFSSSGIFMEQIQPVLQNNGIDQNSHVKRKVKKNDADSKHS